MPKRTLVLGVAGVAVATLFATCSTLMTPSSKVEIIDPPSYMTTTTPSPASFTTFSHPGMYEGVK